MTEGLPKCAPVLLEPIYKIVMSIPSDFTSKAQRLVTGRRGQLLGYDAKPGWPGGDEVVAQLPEAELHDLIIELRSATLGVGSFTCSFDHLAEFRGKLPERAEKTGAAPRSASPGDWRCVDRSGRDRSPRVDAFGEQVRIARGAPDSLDPDPVEHAPEAIRLPACIVPRQVQHIAVGIGNADDGDVLIFRVGAGFDCSRTAQCDAVGIERRSIKTSLGEARGAANDCWHDDKKTAHR